MCLVELCVCVCVCVCVCSAWLSDWESVEIGRISDRASAIANLTLFTAEQMQVNSLTVSLPSVSYTHLTLPTIYSV